MTSSSDSFWIEWSNRNPGVWTNTTNNFNNDMNLRKKRCFYRILLSFNLTSFRRFVDIRRYSISSHRAGNILAIAVERKYEGSNWSHQTKLNYFIRGFVCKYFWNPTQLFKSTLVQITGIPFSHNKKSCFSQSAWCGVGRMSQVRGYAAASAVYWSI